MSRPRASGGRRAPARRRAVAVVVALAAASAAAAAAGIAADQASAHAVLQHTSPHRDASVARAPAAVRLDFSEPVDVGPAAVRVFDEEGDRVDAGVADHPAGRPRSVSVALRGGLAPGVYTATYRIVSADGHPVSGGFAFGVGVPVSVARDRPQVADLLARSSAGAGVEGAYGVARGLQYAALLLLVGAVAFRLLVWPAGTDAGGAPRWPSRVLVAAAVLGALASLAGVALQGALGAGVPLGQAWDGTVLDASLQTRSGEAWLIRGFLWAFVLVFALLYRSVRTRVEVVALAVPAAALVATLPYAGHADTQTPKAVLIPADVVHVLAAGTWLGGLVLLLACFWPRGGGAVVRDGAAEATARFSRLALPAILVLVVAGSAQAWFYLGSVGALFGSTYGWALVAKTVLLGGIVALAAGNRRRTGRLGHDEPDPARRLRRAMGAEVLLGVLVLAATATLVRAAPPQSVAAGPVARELDLGPLRVQLDVEPASVGPNDYHLYLFDRRTGAQVDRVAQLSVRLVQRERDIGPITLDIPRKGPAHYELLASVLGVAGTWEATVTVRVSEFDEHSARTRIEVRR